jgi:hypothetical protein
MIILPEPPAELPPGFITLEMALKRDQTAWFIAANPVTLTLTPIRKDRTSSGASVIVDLPPRAPQKLRLISMSASQKPTITEDGVEREIDLTLLGPWDAQIDIGDWWRDGEGLLYEVIEMVPHNGYETRALVVKKGHG